MRSCEGWKILKVFQPSLMFYHWNLLRKGTAKRFITMDNDFLTKGADVVHSTIE